eukprot:GHVN01053195.1.p2 GENE.GHVN01053195.1~~GHVN01053195.1.p2  ORF type:complete len:100 (-),score=1.34 GHVN01053195.1:958-1257(-)
MQSYILTEIEGGRRKPFLPGYKPQFFIKTLDITGSIDKIISNDIEREMALPGDFVSLHITLNLEIPLSKKSKVTIREGSKTIGAGIITDLSNDLEFKKI